MGYSILFATFVILSVIFGSILYIALPEEPDSTKKPKSILGGLFLGFMITLFYHKFKKKLPKLPKLGSQVQYLNEDFDE